MFAHGEDTEEALLSGDGFEIGLLRPQDGAAPTGSRECGCFDAVSDDVAICHGDEQGWGLFGEDLREYDGPREGYGFLADLYGADQLKVFDVEDGDCCTTPETNNENIGRNCRYLQAGNLVLRSKTLLCGYFQTVGKIQYI